MNILQYFQNYATKKPVLDLRGLLAVNLISSTVVLASHRIETTVGAFFISFAALAAFKMFKQAFFYSLLFVGSVFFVTILPSFLNDNIFIVITKVLGMFVFFIGKILPFVMIVHVIFTEISVNYLVASLRKMQLHRGVLLSLVVALRYLPTAKKEFEYIKNAMRLRGIQLSFKNFLKSPLSIIEFSLVPLLFRNVKVAEEMSAAATVKGIEFAGKQSSLLPIKMQAIDYAFILFSTIVLCASFFGFWTIDSLLQLFAGVFL